MVILKVTKRIGFIDFCFCYVLLRFLISYYLSLRSLICSYAFAAWKIFHLPIVFNAASLWSYFSSSLLLFWTLTVSSALSFLWYCSRNPIINFPPASDFCIISGLLKLNSLSTRLSHVARTAHDDCHTRMRQLMHFL